MLKHGLFQHESCGTDQRRCRISQDAHRLRRKHDPRLVLGISDCPSGRLSRSKFLEIYKLFFTTGNPDRFCDHVFRTFDADNNGHIDFKEFLLAIGVTSSSSSEERLKWAFRMYDINKDGRIEQKEMIKIIQALYEMLGPGATAEEDTPEERTKLVFSKMDKDGDGRLTLQEFLDGCLQDRKLAALLTANSALQR
ncbi:neuronal calcium sensor 2-like isoform X2 [Ornithodoros turicata]